MTLNTSTNHFTMSNINPENIPPLNPEELPNAEAIAGLMKFSSPFALIKKALSSVAIVAMIGAGLVINWIVALVFLFSAFSSSTWLGFFGGLALFILVFPALYLFFAYSYGQSIMAWEAYQQVIRPLLARAMSGILDKTLKLEGNEEISERDLVAEIDNRKKHLLERLPDFMRAYVQLFFTGKDIFKLVKEQRHSGGDKERIKQNILTRFFDAFDLQVSELAEPSLIPFLITGVINIVVIYFLF